MPVKAEHKELLDKARARLTLAIGAFSESREDELDDLRFRAGSPDNQWQWPADVLATRGAVEGQTINARPCITINKLPQHVLQVTNDQRQNRPSAKVIPVDDKADPKVAEMLNGIIRHIEYISDADVAYDTACDNQVTFGEGYIRLLTDYCDPMSFDQDIKIGRIRNSFSVYMDPTIQDPAGSDAQWCFITQDMLKEEFEAEFPEATPVSVWMQEGVGDNGMSAWLNEKTVRIAEYFYFENEKKTLCIYKPIPGLLPGGTYLKGSFEAQSYEALEAKPAKERTTTIKRVKWCKTNGYEVLDSKEWAGKWIPVVRVIGNEFEIDGQIYISGLIRNAKDAQRMYNYWVSQEAEMLALAPKAPFIMYAGQDEGFENEWKTANVNNWPALHVNPEVTDQDGRVLPLPQRAPPPLPQAGLIQAKQGAADDIKGTTGQYDPSLGAESNEKSGVAIRARERQSDTGTFHYNDNLAKAIRFLTRQILDLFPKIYDTARVARIIGIDGEVEHVEIDPDQKEAAKEVRDPNGALIKTIYNPSIGTYDVMATTGPSYMTKRQETAAAMVELSQGANDPTVSLVMRYFAIKNMDFPEAQEFAAVIKRLVPPGILDEAEQSPEMAQAKKVIDGLQQQVQAMASMIENAHKSIEAQTAMNETFRGDVEAYKAETQRIAALLPIASPDALQGLVRDTIIEMMSEPSLASQQQPQVEQPMPQPQPAEMAASPQPGVM